MIKHRTLFHFIFIVSFSVILLILGLYWVHSHTLGGSWKKVEMLHSKTIKSKIDEVENIVLQDWEEKKASIVGLISTGEKAINLSGKSVFIFNKNVFSSEKQSLQESAFYILYDLPSKSWSEIKEFPKEIDTSSLQLNINSEGEVLGVWCEGSCSVDHYILKSSLLKNGSWESGKKIFEGNGSAKHISLMPIKNNQSVLVWLSQLSTGIVKKYKIYSTLYSEGSWSIPQVIQSEKGQSVSLYSLSTSKLLPTLTWSVSYFDRSDEPMIKLAQLDPQTHNWKQARKLNFIKENVCTGYNLRPFFSESENELQLFSMIEPDQKLCFSYKFE